MMSSKVKGYLLAAFSAVTYGSIPLFAVPLKQTDLSFDTVLVYRFLFSSVLFGLYLIYKRTGFRVSKKEFGVLVMLGLTYALSSHFLFIGYDYMPAGVASTILFMYPVFVALIMGIFFREKISWIMWTAILLAFAGVYELNNSGEGGSLNPVGLGVVLLSALAYALYIVIVNKSAAGGMPGTKVSFYSMVVCTLFFLVRSFMNGTFQLIPTVGAGINLTLFALVPTVLSLLSMVYAVKLIGSTPTAVMGSMEPVVAVAISVALFNEPLTGNLITGIVMIVAAVAVTVMSGPIMSFFKKAVNIIRPYGNSR